MAQCLSHDHRRRIGVPVEVAGPEKGSVVVLLGAAQKTPAAYEAVCQRLHTASLRTVVIGPDPRLTAKSVIGILDALEVRWALLVGDRFGGELAWELAATRSIGSSVWSSSTAVTRGWPICRAWSVTSTARRWS